MNENIDLIKILKDCPKGTKLYSTVFGEVEFDKISEDSNYPIVFVTTDGTIFDITANGKYYDTYGEECTLFPSKDQRDWSKFTAPWYKKEKFDPKTLKPFDRVLVRDSPAYSWRCAFYSHTKENGIDNYGYGDYQIGVCDGVRLADKTMIEKACNWLREQKEMIGISFQEDFIERFKMAMKK